LTSHTTLDDINTKVKDALSTVLGIDTANITLGEIDTVSPHRGGTPAQQQLQEGDPIRVPYTLSSSSSSNTNQIYQRITDPGFQAEVTTALGTPVQVGDDLHVPYTIHNTSLDAAKRQHIQDLLAHGEFAVDGSDDVSLRVPYTIRNTSSLGAAKHQRIQDLLSRGEFAVDGSDDVSLRVPYTIGNNTSSSLDAAKHQSVRDFLAKGDFAIDDTGDLSLHIPYRVHATSLESIIQKTRHFKHDLLSSLREAGVRIADDDVEVGELTLDAILHKVSITLHTDSVEHMQRLRAIMKRTKTFKSELERKLTELKVTDVAVGRVTLNALIAKLTQLKVPLIVHASTLAQAQAIRNIMRQTDTFEKTLKTALTKAGLTMRERVEVGKTVTLSALETGALFRLPYTVDASLEQSQAIRAIAADATKFKADLLQQMHDHGIELEGDVELGDVPLTDLPQHLTVRVPYTVDAESMEHARLVQDAIGQTGQFEDDMRTHLAEVTKDVDVGQVTSDDMTHAKRTFDNWERMVIDKTTDTIQQALRTAIGEGESPELMAAIAAVTSKAAIQEEISPTDAGWRLVLDGCEYSPKCRAMLQEYPFELGRKYVIQKEYERLQHTLHARYHQSQMAALAEPYAPPAQYNTRRWNAASSHLAAPDIARMTRRNPAYIRRNKTMKLFQQKAARPQNARRSQKQTAEQIVTRIMELEDDGQIRRTLSGHPSQVLTNILFFVIRDKDYASVASDDEICDRIIAWKHNLDAIVEDLKKSTSDEDTKVKLLEKTNLELTHVLFYHIGIHDYTAATSKNALCNKLIAWKKITEDE
jgi:hypothetical protein